MQFTRLAVAGCVVALAVQAQSSPPADQAAPTQKVAVSQQKGDWELGLFTGAVIPPGGGGVNVGGGANIAYALSSIIYPYFEFSVLPGAINQTATAGSTQVQTSGNLLDFHGGVHIRIPVNPRFVPYGVFAVGGYKPYSASTRILDTSTNPPTVDATAPITGGSFIFNYGGGVRYYATNTVGVRFEVTAYGPTSHFSGGTPVRVMGGVFFQFKKNSH